MVGCTLRPGGRAESIFAARWIWTARYVQLRPVTQFLLYGQYLQHLVCRKFSSQIMEVFYVDACDLLQQQI